MIKSGIMYKQRDILLIPVPFSDLTSYKKRPVLVLSNDNYNRTSEDIIVAAITSKVDKRNYSVIIKSEDLSEGEMKIKSMIRVDKIYTLSQEIIIKKFGELKIESFEKVKKEITKLIDIKNT